jgi:protein involved in polysaccharide export with SLBB domain
MRGARILLAAVSRSRLPVAPVIRSSKLLSRKPMRRHRSTAGASTRLHRLTLNGPIASRSITRRKQVWCWSKNAACSPLAEVHQLLRHSHATATAGATAIRHRRSLCHAVIHLCLRACAGASRGRAALHARQRRQAACRVRPGRHPNSYTVDAGGKVNLPLIGAVPARGVTTQQLSGTITWRLKQGYVREPHVSVEVETYRPFFILGEVTTPGQYPYVVNMTAETAIAGGFAPRAYKKTVKLTRKVHGEQIGTEVPLDYPVRPGDTILVTERWF